jgi:hypothetical protein
MPIDGSFLLGLTYCDGREWEINIIFIHWLLFFWGTGNAFISMFDYDTKEKEHQNTRQSDKYLGLRPLVQIRYRISTFFCGNFISAISAVRNDTADLKTAEN